MKKEKKGGHMLAKYKRKIEEEDEKFEKAKRRNHGEYLTHETS
jgi:hypothetical protein